MGFLFLALQLNTCPIRGEPLGARFLKRWISVDSSFWVFLLVSSCSFRCLQTLIP